MIAPSDNVFEPRAGGKRKVRISSDIKRSMTLLGTLWYRHHFNIQKIKYPEMANITTFNAVGCAMVDDYVEKGTCTRTACFIIMLYLLHDLSLTSNSSGPFVIPDHSVWNMWWMQCHWDKFFSKYFSFTLPVSFH